MAEAPDRSGPTLLTTGGTAQTIVSAGAASGWPIIRGISVVNETTGDVKITLGIFTSAADAVGRRVTAPNKVLHAGEEYEWEGFRPLKTGEVLYAVCDTNNGATVTAAIVTGP